ncbi:MAG: amidohydrolase family protein, partial [Gammaproteobacteria bacterium]|nr:amidohydrolase family protein [Gammaproteobacteria bacterium]
MQTIDTLIHAEWVVPIEPVNTTLHSHSLCIDNGKIVAILPTPDAKQQFQADNQFDLSGHAVMPGLVNAHTHAAMSLMRGLADDLPLMTWLQEHIWPTEQRWVNERFIEDGT